MKKSIKTLNIALTCLMSIQVASIFAMEPSNPGNTPQIDQSQPSTGNAAAQNTNQNGQILQTTPIDQPFGYPSLPAGADAQNPNLYPNTMTETGVQNGATYSIIPTEANTQNQTNISGAQKTSEAKKVKATNQNEDPDSSAQFKMPKFLENMGNFLSPYVSKFTSSPYRNRIIITAIGLATSAIAKSKGLAIISGLFAAISIGIPKVFPKLFPTLVAGGKILASRFHQYTSTKQTPKESVTVNMQPNEIIMPLPEKVSVTDTPNIDKDGKTILPLDKKKTPLFKSLLSGIRNTYNNTEARILNFCKDAKTGVRDFCKDVKASMEKSADLEKKAVVKSN